MEGYDLPSSGSSEFDNLPPEWRNLSEAVRELGQRLNSIDARLSALEGLRPGRTDSPEGTIHLRPYGGYQVEFKRHYEQPLEQVWDAITQPQRQVDWLAETSVDAREGGKIELCFANSGSVTHGIITEMVRPNVFEHMWVTGQVNSPTQPIPGELAAGNGTCGDLTLAASRIRFDLAAASSGGTDVTMRHIIPLNPDLVSVPMARSARSNSARFTEEPRPDMVLASWEIHLDLLGESLRNPGNRTMSLSGTRSANWPWGDFEEVRKRYARTVN